MGKKVGVLVFTDKVKDRSTRKNNYFDSLPYAGLNSLLSELKDEYEVSFVSPETIDTVDFVFVSIISYFDIYNLFKALDGKKHNSKIIVGGAGLSNIRPIKDSIDIAVFGRTEGRIKKILLGEPLPNVWYKEDDPELLKKYEFGKTEFLIKNDYIQERSVGCRRKCAFCEYSWTHDFVSEGQLLNYTSGSAEYEDFFQTFSWEKAQWQMVTAIDGITEKTRQMVFKPLTRDEFKTKLFEAYEKLKNRADVRASVKVYAIIGYPWEKEEDANLEELKEDFQKVDKEQTEIRVLMPFLFSHFVPCPFTPLQWEKINLINFRNELLKKRNFRIHEGKNFHAWVHGSIKHPVSIVEEVLTQRGYEKDKESMRIVTSKKYAGLDADKRLEVLLKYLPSYIYEEYEIGSPLATDYMKPMYNAIGMAKTIRKWAC